MLINLIPQWSLLSFNSLWDLICSFSLVLAQYLPPSHFFKDGFIWSLGLSFIGELLQAIVWQYQLSNHYFIYLCDQFISRLNAKIPECGVTTLPCLLIWITSIKDDISRRHFQTIIIDDYFSNQLVERGFWLMSTNISLMQ